MHFHQFHLIFILFPAIDLSQRVITILAHWYTRYCGLFNVPCVFTLMSCITWSFLPVIMWVYKDKIIVEIPTFARNENVFRAISALVLVMQVACCILCSVKLFHPRIPRISLDINAACVRFSWKRFLFSTRAIVDLKEVRGRGLEWIPKVLKKPS